MGNADSITFQPAYTLCFLTMVSFASNSNFTIILNGTIAYSVEVIVNYWRGSDIYSRDVSTLAKGQYFLPMNNTHQVKTSRFIKP